MNDKQMDEINSINWYCEVAKVIINDLAALMKKHKVEVFPSSEAVLGYTFGKKLRWASREELTKYLEQHVLRTSVQQYGITSRLPD